MKLLRKSAPEDPDKIKARESSKRFRDKNGSPLMRVRYYGKLKEDYCAFSCMKCHKTFIDTYSNRPKLAIQFFVHAKTCGRTEEELKASRRDTRVRRQKKTQAFAARYKQFVGCYACRERCSAVLDFHHKDASEKEKRMDLDKISIKTLKLEIKKCIVLCANCHRKYHASLYSLLYTDPYYHMLEVRRNVVI